MYEQLISWHNLLLAYRKASKGKRGQPNVAAFEHLLEQNLAELQEKLRDKTYVPGAYDSFYIHDPKRRLISAAPFRDRVVHHALCNIIEPIFERSFIFDSYANRVGKGTHRALDRCQQFCRKYNYVLQLDLRQFFASIDHAILRRTLSRSIRDSGVTWLIDRILASGEGILHETYDMVYFPGDDLLAADRPRGLPIGNLTSQFWANVYLNPLDHFIKRELCCKAYLRYVDDLLLFSESKKDLWQWQQQIQRRLTTLRPDDAPGYSSAPGVRWGAVPGFHCFPATTALETPQMGALRAQIPQNAKQLFARRRTSVQNFRVRARLGESCAFRQYRRPEKSAAIRLLILKELSLAQLLTVCTSSETGSDPWCLTMLPSESSCHPQKNNQPPRPGK